MSRVLKFVFGLTDCSKRREKHNAYCPSNTSIIELEEQKDAIDGRNPRNRDELTRYLCCHAKHNEREGGVVQGPVKEETSKQKRLREIRPSTSC